MSVRPRHTWTPAPVHVRDPYLLDAIPRVERELRVQVVPQRRAVTHFNDEHRVRAARMAATTLVRTRPEQRKVRHGLRVVTEPYRALHTHDRLLSQRMHEQAGQPDRSAS